jgi:hypothetical protein
MYNESPWVFATCLGLFLLFICFIYLWTCSLDSNHIKYYYGVSHQIIRHALRLHGPFAESGLPWITTYVLRSTDTYTRISEKKTIYLVIRRPDGSFYDGHTIIRTMIHELAHLYHDSGDHDDMFRAIEKQLLKSSAELGYYDPDREVDRDYPCKH